MLAPTPVIDARHPAERRGVFGHHFARSSFARSIDGNSRQFIHNAALNLFAAKSLQIARRTHHHL